VKHRDVNSSESTSRLIAGEAAALVARMLQRCNGTAVISREFLDRIEKFAGLLALWGARTNLTAHPDDPAEIAFHVLDSLAPILLASRPDGVALRGHFDASRRALDIGSGAGFPGLILAAASQAQFTLCESRQKRASFLSIASAEMGLRNVTVETSPATFRRFGPTFGVTTARALGGLADFYRIAASALRDGGVAIVYASPSQRLDLASARALGFEKAARLEYEVARRDDALKRALVILRKCQPGT
jgi:16S rRNA (guanine527-N7)-methyltransferase